MNERSSEMLVGVGKSLIAVVRFESGVIPVFEAIWPANEMECETSIFFSDIKMFKSLQQLRIFRQLLINFLFVYSPDENVVNDMFAEG